MSTGKIFIDKNDELVGLDYAPSINSNYYSYIKDKVNLGYSQFVITSEIMIKLIEILCIEKEYTLTKIELLHEDCEEENTISSLISSMEQEKLYFHKLIEELRFIKKQSSIDLKRLHFVGKIQEGRYFRFYIQVNGIYGIDDRYYGEITKDLIKTLKRCVKNE